LLVAAGVCALSAGASTNIPSAQAAVSIKDPLVIDAYDKTNYAHEGDVASLFTFSIRNDSADGIVIDDMKTSCGCTVAAMPSKPWYVKPGESNLFKVLIDIREKTGILRKDVWVESSNYSRALALTVDILPSAGTNDVNPKLQLRLFGQQLAAVDRTQIFTQDECLHCHLVPAFGKSGEQLFHVACGICHESKHRATMVPDLSALKTEIDPDYWRRWVTHGKPGTLMPGFDSRERGPLDDADIDGLVKYLTTAFPRPVKTSAPQK
jgi:cytochrome c553